MQKGMWGLTMYICIYIYKHTRGKIAPESCSLPNLHFDSAKIVHIPPIHGGC